MTKTSTVRVAYVELEPDKGAVISECIADALEYAAINRVDVRIVFNGNRYSFYIKDLLTSYTKTQEN